MAGDKDAPQASTEEQEMANGTANMLAHAAAATQASEAESRDSFKGQLQRPGVNTSIPPAAGDYSARSERPTRL
jgi:hypothetical protein